MNAGKKIKYHSKWKETLVGEIGDYSFHIELTMGILTVYFPTEETWNESAPSWAKGCWEMAKFEAEKWCNTSNIPMVIDHKSWVDFIEK